MARVKPSRKKGESFLFGDKDIDIEAPKAAGIRGHRFAGDNLLDFID